MKKIFVMLALSLFCASAVYSATISYRHYGNTRMRKRLTDVTLLKIDWKYISFTHKGKTYKIQRKWMDAFIPDAVTNASKASASASGNAKTSKSPAAENKSFPTKLAAYILHCRYLFGAGQSDDWYYGKQVTVSGVVELKAIKRANPGDLIGSKAVGQYQVPMLNGSITCLTNESLAKLVTIKSIKLSPYVVEVSKKYAVMKFRGTVVKSQRYKEAFISNAKLISARYILSSKTCKRSPNNGKHISRTQKLAKTSNLKYSAYLEQQAGGIGRIQCIMGTDPEAYAMEVHWLRKLFKPARTLNLTVSGIPYVDGNRFSKLSDGSIIRWSVPLNKKK